MTVDLAANKKNAISFYKTAYLGNPKEAVDNYIGDDYIQHNPLVGDGKEAFIDYFEQMRAEYSVNKVFCKKKLNFFGHS